MAEWRRETHVLTKSGSRHTKFRTTTFADWKKANPMRIGTSSERLLKKISKNTDINHITKVAMKNPPALLSFFPLLEPPPPPPPAPPLPLIMVSLLFLFENSPAKFCTFSFLSTVRRYNSLLKMKVQSAANYLMRNEGKTRL